MAIDQSFNRFQAMEREVADLREQIEARSGGGGDDGGDVDQRVTRLESQFDKVADKIDRHGDRIGGIEAQLAAIKERLNHMPTKYETWQIAMAVIGATLVIVTFADKLQSLVG